MNKVKLKVFIILTIVILICGASIAYSKHNQNVKMKEELSAAIASIDSSYGAFENEKDEVKKLDALNSLLKEYQDYKDSGKSVDAINEYYEEKIERMKNWFEESYSKKIDENTLVDVDDVDKINEAKSNLENTLNSIKSNKALNESESEKFIASINDLIKSYDERINAIMDERKKAEEERLAKEEAERIAAESSKINQGSDDSSNSGGANQPGPYVERNGGSSNNGGESAGNSAGSSSESQRNSGGVDISRFEHTWNVDADGNKIPGTDRWVDPATGNAYDANGNFLGSALW